MDTKGPAMDRKKKIKRKIIITILLGMIAVCVYIYLLNVGQDITVTRQFQEEMAEDVENLKGGYTDASKRHGYMQESFDTLYLQDLDFIYFRILGYLDEYSSDDVSYPDKIESIATDLSVYLNDIDSTYFDYNIAGIMIADAKGNTIAAGGAMSPMDLRDERYDPLREVFVTYEEASVRLLTEEDACLNYSDEKRDYREIDKEKICNLYAKHLYDDYELVIAIDAIDETILEADSDAWTVLLQNEIIGDEGYVFVWSEETNKILYYPKHLSDQSLKYQDIEKLGMDMEKIHDREFGWNTINGKKMYIYPAYDEERNVWIACAVSKTEMISSRRIVMLTESVVFALLAAALVYYVILLLRQDKIRVLTDFTGSGITYAHQSRQYKLFFITVMISAVLMLFAFYLQTLFLMSTWAESASWQTQRIEETAASNEEKAEKFTALYDKAIKVRLSAFARYLSNHEDEWNSESLDGYSSNYKISNIQILGVNGNSKAGTSYMSYSAKVKEQNTDESSNYKVIVENQDNGRKACDWMADGRKDMQAMTDADGRTIGYVYIFYYRESVDLVLKSLSLEGTLEMVRPGRNGFVFSVDRKEYTFLYYPDDSMVGEDALEYGLQKKQIRDNYCDYINVNNVSYYANTDRIGGSIVFFAVNKVKLLQQRLFLSVTVVLMAFILFLLIGIMIYTSRERIEMITPEDEKHIGPDSPHTAEYSLMQILKYYMAFGATVVVIYTSLHGVIRGITVLEYVLDGGWENGLNVFALTASLIILCRGGLVLLIANRLLLKIRNIFSARTNTILKMLASLCTYVAAAVLLYQCMVCFGLNPTALMASTGIVAVVLGIGANSLVGDIIAGIFLLMEGDVQIGDVVQVAGFRGYVMELGIRMTKLYDMDTDDIKIIPNNEIRNVVHMTMRRACVFSEFQIRYEENLEDVERILKEELKNVKVKSPYILDGPNYIGVSRLGDSGVCLKTSTKCHEAHRKKVEREVNHIVYTIFQKHNIDVPYPQVTLHTGDDARVERTFPEEESGKKETKD